MSLLIDAAKKHQSGDLTCAASLYQAFLRENAEDADALNLYGLCMHELGNLHRADALFSSAIRCNPENSEFYHNRGVTRLGIGKRTHALADFESGLTYNPDNYRSLIEAGRASIDLQEIDKAVKFFEKALDIAKNDESAIVGLSYSLSLRGLRKTQEKNFADAIKDFTDALKLCPQTWEILYNLGNAYLKSGNYQLAWHQYEKALQLNDSNVQLLCNRGIVSERLGAFSKAAAAYKKKKAAELSDAILNTFKTGLFNTKYHPSIGQFTLPPNLYKDVYISGFVAHFIDLNLEFNYKDIKKGKAVRTLKGHRSSSHALSFHPYGSFMVSGSSDNNVKIWDIRAKSCIITYSGHRDIINDVQCSPDGQWVASASADRSIKLWDLVAGKLMVDLTGHTGSVQAVHFHPEEFLLVSGSADRTVRCWDLETFSTRIKLTNGANGVRKSLFVRGGSEILTGSDNDLKVWKWSARTPRCALKSRGMWQRMQAAQEVGNDDDDCDCG